MRVLHAYKVFRPDIEGGIPAVISQLTRMNEYGDQVSILTVRDRGPARRFELEGTPVTALRSFAQISSMPIAPQFPFALNAAAKHCDVLALHAPFPLNDLGLALGVPDTVAVVIHWHADILGRKAVMPAIAPLIRRSLARADRIVVSDASIIDGSPFLHSHREKCAVAPYGIEPTDWSELDDEGRVRAERLRNTHPRLVISMGRLVPYKGFPVLLQALRAIDGHLVIIGEGSEYDHLKKLAAQLGVTDKLTLTGFLPRETMKAYLHAARLFVLPSVTAAEAFGIVQIEAMAAGLAVVNTDLPTAVPTIARDGAEGFTVAPNDSAALTKVINCLLDDEPLAKRLGLAGQHRVATEYSEKVFLQRIRAIYAAAAESRRGTGR